MSSFFIEMSDYTRMVLRDAIEALSESSSETVPVISMGAEGYPAGTPAFTFDEESQEFRNCQLNGESIFHLLLGGHPVSHINKQWVVQLLGFGVQIAPYVRSLMVGRELGILFVSSTFWLVLTPSPSDEEIRQVTRS